MSVKQEDHDALLAEVQRLELELGKVKQDLQGVVGCKGKCDQLNTLQDTVSNVIGLICVFYNRTEQVFTTSSTFTAHFFCHHDSVCPLPQISAQVSSQVRKELRALFFGSGQAGEEQGEVPESLILWLSQRYVSTPDLQASLASLELNILRNVSWQVEQSQAQTLSEAESQAKTIVQTVTGSVQHSATAEGLSEEVMSLNSAVKINIVVLDFFIIIT